MSNYNTQLQSNNTNLQQLIEKVNNLPEAGSGGLDTSDATASANDLLDGKTAYVDGKKITGTIPTQEGSTITPNKETQVAISSGTYAAGDIVVEPIPDTYVFPKTIVSGAMTLTPAKNDITVPAGSYFAQGFTLKGDMDLLSSNIKDGVEIFGVTGTYSGDGLDTSDATATAEDIMLGETAYNAEGKITGTFTIQDEIDDINTRISNIKTALENKASGSGGSGKKTVTITVKTSGLGSISYFDETGTQIVVNSIATTTIEAYGGLVVWKLTSDTARATCTGSYIDLGQFINTWDEYFYSFLDDGGTIMMKSNLPDIIV